MANHDKDLPSDFLERIDPEAFSVAALIGLVVYHHGAPLSFEEIAAGLADLGIVRSTPSLKKTWAKLRCLRKTVDGKLELVRENTEFSVWDTLAFRVRENLGLLSRPRATPKPAKPPIDDRSPVGLEELEQGLIAGLPSAVSLRRKLALFAEASHAPVTIERAIKFFRDQGCRLTEKDVRRSVGGPVFADEDGRLRPVPQDGSLIIARGLLRKHLRELGERAEQEKASARNTEEWKKKRRIEGEEKHARYLKARKAVIRCVFTRTGLNSASVLDPDRREFHDFTDRDELVSYLGRCDIVLGLDPWSDFERLSFKPRGQVVDLSPPVKTVRLNRQGRTLKVTPELIILSTLSISRPLGDRKKLLEYVKQGNFGKLFRRLQSDLKALWRLYEYGCLHGTVRLRWGYLDERRGIDWNVGEMPRLYELFEQAKESGDDLEIVLDSAPGWEDPWSRGLRARVIRVEGMGWDRCYVVELVDTCLQRLLYEDEVFAARPFPKAPPPTANRSPEHTRVESENKSLKRVIAWPDERDDQVS